MVKFSPSPKLAVWQEREKEGGGQKDRGSLMRGRVARLYEGSLPIKGLQRSGNGQILTKWEKCGHHNTQGGS